MTDRRVDSTASGGADGTTWNDAYLTVNAALAASSAGDRILVDDGHSESTASALSITDVAGTAANPIQILSVDKDSGENPTTISPGATITTTSTSGMTIGSGADQQTIMDGITLKTNGNLSVSTDSAFRFYNGRIELTQAAGNVIDCGADNLVQIFGSVFKFADTGQQIRLTDGYLEMADCSIDAAGTKPDNLFKHNTSNASGRAYVRDCDFTHISGTGAMYFYGYNANVTGGNLIRFHNIKIASGAVPVNASGTGAFKVRVECRNVTAGDTIYDTYIFDRNRGTIQDETTTVLDATYDGTNKYSLAFAHTIASAGNLTLNPISECIAELFLGTANPTITVELTSDATLTNQEFWIEVEYPDETVAALGKIATSINANRSLGSGTTLTTSSASWTSAKTNKYKVEVTVSGGAVGVHRVWAFLAPATSKTAYVDPHVTVS